MLTSVAISSSGECLAFGGSGGYVHLWAPTHDPAVNQIRQVGSRRRRERPSGCAALWSNDVAAADTAWAPRARARKQGLASPPSLPHSPTEGQRKAHLTPPLAPLPQALVLPEPHTTLVSLSEEDPLCLAPTYFPMDASGLLSDVEPFESVAVGLPPRVVDATLLKSMRQVGSWVEWNLARRWRGGLWRQRFSCNKAYPLHLPAHRPPAQPVCAV